MDLAAVADELRRVTVAVLDGDAVAGSGVVWAPGFIVTNAHVVRRPAVQLRTAEGRCLPGRVVARDGRADLALVRAPEVERGADIPVDSGPVRVGALIFAIGHPFGMRASLTRGIVHAVGPIVAGGPPYIQADLRLAPGNSGGPLADARGRLLGVNSMIAGALALAIPVDEVGRFLRRAGVEAPA